MIGMLFQRSCLSVGILLASFEVAFSGNCPSGWTVFQDSCYYFGSPRLSFYEAAHFCGQHQGSHLVHVDSYSENLFIKDHLRISRFGASWMGLADDSVEGLWQLYGGSDSGSSPRFTDWASGQPDDGRHNEDCAQFSSLWDYRWNDETCSEPGHPVCEINAESGMVHSVVG